MTSISVIIPTFNEEETIEECIDCVRVADPAAEIIVADGGSLDATVERAKKKGAVVIGAQRGRGYQCNAGATRASGTLYLFLHADTKLPPNAITETRTLFQDPCVQIAKFRVEYDEPHWLLNGYSRVAPYDSLVTSFGDQGIVIRSEFLAQLGGYPQTPLFEDVGLFQRARKQTEVHLIDATVTTSARRFRQNGVIRQFLLDAWYLIQYVCGVSPRALAAQYEQGD